MRSTRHVASPEIGPEPGHYSDPPLLILASLANGPKHGHAMIEDIASLCGTRLGPGTLYGSLDRMMRDRLVEESGISDDERRRFYRLTSQGHAVLAAELERLEAAVNSARSLGLLPQGGR